LTKSDRWILSEFLVARDRTSLFGDSLLYHRQVTPYAELDLIFESTMRAPDGLVRCLTIIEVKSVSAGLWAREVVSRKQRLRLERARWYVELKAQRRTRLILATVETGPAGNPVIHYFDAPF
jgi:Holliday junction resolvase-like predicted endonuclease